MHTSLIRRLSQVLLGSLLVMFVFPGGVAWAETREQAETYFNSHDYEVQGKTLQNLSASQQSSSTGAFVYQYPLNLPQGRDGLTPSLSLTYNNQDQDAQSWVGMGWSLNTPSISRLSRHGVDQMYEVQEFSSSLSGDLVAVQLIDDRHGEYASKTEEGSFLKYEFLADDSWQVTDKSGMIYRFGIDMASRKDDPVESSHVTAWFLQKTEDSNGNWIEYEYTKDEGQIYPASIHYTGHEAEAAPFEIVFNLEARDDATTFFNSGFSVHTRYRLGSIDVLANGRNLHDYDLSYISAEGTQRSLLDGITESATDERGQTQVKDPTTFDYDFGNKGWALQENYETPLPLDSVNQEQKGLELGDVNGDSLIDFLQSTFTGSPAQRRLYLNNGNSDGWTQDASWDIPFLFYNFSSNDYRGVRMADVNGDSRSDFLNTGVGGSNDVFLNNGHGWVRDASYSLPSTFYHDGSDLRNPLAIVDINADGLTDFVESWRESTTTRQRSYLNQGDGTWREDLDSVPPMVFWDSGDLKYLGYRAVDVNGDGLTDFIQSFFDSGPTDTKKVYINQGDNTWAEDANYTIPEYFWTGNSWEYRGIRLNDVNGDGLPDILKSYGDASSSFNVVYLNRGNGTGWSEDPDYEIPIQFESGDESLGVAVFDVNGDGMSDLVQSDEDRMDSQYIYLNTQTSQQLSGIHLSEGGSTQITYKNSAEYEDAEGELSNPNLPFGVSVVDSVVNNDGLGSEHTTSYDYSGGDYFYEDEFNRQFSGFAQITRTEEGRVTQDYYMQDSRALIGKIYKTEVSDDSGRLYQVNLDTWGTSDLGNDRTYVYKSRTVQMSYDGGETHKDVGTSFDYDLSNGNLLKQTEWGEVTARADGTFTDVVNEGEKRMQIFSYAVDPAGMVRNKVSSVKTQKANGKRLFEEQYLYDGLPFGTVGLGNLTGKRQWLDSDNSWVSSSYVVDDYGLTTSQTDPRGATTTTTYDALHLYPATITNALSQSVTLEYDLASGQVTQSTNANGAVQETAYDGFGRPTSISVPDPATGVATEITTLTYDDHSLPSSVTTESTVDGVSFGREEYYDGFKRLIQSRSSNENGEQTWVDYEYDSLGNLSRKTLPYSEESGLATEYRYDPLGRVTSEISPLGTTSTGYANWTQRTVDGNGHIKKQVADAFGRLIRVDEKNGTETYTTRYDYNELNQLTKIKDAQSNVRNFTYDSLGRTLTQEDLHVPTATQFGVYKMRYDSNGNLTQRLDPKNQTITRIYDSLNRMTQENWSTTPQPVDIAYVYDTAVHGIGLPASISMQGFSVAYAYDFAGNAQTETKTIATVPYTTRTDFDLLGRPKTITYPGSPMQVGYEYNEAGQLERVTKDGTDIVSNIDYDVTNQASRIEYGNGTVTTLSHDPAFNNLTANRTTTNALGDIQDLDYSYDSVGNILSIADDSITPTAKTVAYTYDDLNRLLTAQTTGLASGDYSQSYTYDSVGNLLTKSDLGTLTYSGRGFPNPHAATSVNSAALTYDKNGNLLSDGTHSYTWNIRNQLIGSGAHSFNYDPFGTRVREVNGAAITTYVSPLLEVRPEGSIQYIYAGSTRVASVDAARALTYFHQDHLGGTVLASDATGAVTEVYDYHPYGTEAFTETGATEDTHHTFSDKEYEDDLGLYYFEARWYNPRAGRFASEDPAQWDSRVTQVLLDPQSLNFYSYARNNPVNLTDMSGESWWNPTTWDWKSIGQSTLQVLDMMPGFGDVSDAYAAGSGVTLFAGEELSEAEQTMAIILMEIPVVTVGQVRLVDEMIGLITRLDNVSVKSFGQEVYNGARDLTGEIKAIRNGYINDGKIFHNKEGFLPTQSDPNYYKEFEIQTPNWDKSGAGPERIVTGQSGEMYYTSDHYQTFQSLNQ